MGSKDWWENRLKDIGGGLDTKETFGFISNVAGFVGFGYLIISLSFSGLSDKLKVLAALLVGCVYILIWVWVAHIVSARTRFHLVDMDKGGTSLIEHIRGAKHSIRTTHFKAEPPSEGYVGMLVDKLKEGVVTKRIYYRDPNARAGAYDWLMKFADFKESYHQLVTEFWLPYNIVVIDKHIVWLFLPEEKGGFYNRGVWLKNAEAGHLFANAFDCFIDKYGKPEPAPTTVAATA